MAYHSFQASAGMFTYINENFLHAPSSDLSRDTVKTLIQIMLAQATEVFLEKQIMDQKKVGLLAKLSSQAAYLYTQALEGTQENVNKVIFEKVWHILVQVRVNTLEAMFLLITNTSGGTGEGELLGVPISVLPSTSRRRRQ